MILVTPHAIARFRQRVAHVSPAAAMHILSGLPLPASDSVEQRIPASYETVQYTAVVRGETLTTVWRD